MAKPGTTHESIGSRIGEFRKNNALTQMELAERYGISGPAIFKFEKGYATPSLKLWMTIAEDIGIPEKRAVQVWIGEKLSSRFRDLVGQSPACDTESLKAKLREAGKGPDGSAKMRELIDASADIAPSLKRFAADTETWNVLKPTIGELEFLVSLDETYPLLTPAQLRDAVFVARDIAGQS